MAKYNLPGAFGVSVKDHLGEHYFTKEFVNDPANTDFVRNIINRAADLMESGREETIQNAVKRAFGQWVRDKSASPEPAGNLQRFSVTVCHNISVTQAKMIVADCEDTARNMAENPCNFNANFYDFGEIENKIGNGEASCETEVLEVKRLNG